MRKLSRGAAVVVGIVAIAISSAGCGGTVIDQEKLEDTVQKSLEGSLHEKITAVDCPSDQAVDPGSTFTCEVIFPDGKRDSAKLKIRNKDADISIVGLKQTK
jgi:hypothetical protein